MHGHKKSKIIPREGLLVQSGASKLDIVNSTDSAFFIMKIVSLDPHCIFILVVSLSSSQIP